MIVKMQKFYHGQLSGDIRLEKNSEYNLDDLGVSPENQALLVERGFAAEVSKVAQAAKKVTEAVKGKTDEEKGGETPGTVMKSGGSGKK